ncbi:MerR family transcriptional regulator [Bacillus solimangrovi]|uniref:MerR family transcriptional regulator n=1 Tax=Bacillus solimangrovi TaxID=1305675 RepID=A0A1E5LED8_9BACI|nr:MerR family transcriptional regulator [Bacillus solimangrovi]OEH92445.1 MerR family transcriptional regulator [Bacillus solimangrovi]
MYSIGEVAKTVGISAHTLRYYEKENIIEPIRKPNGDRMYDDTHVQWLQFVLKLRDTQMPIAQIREYATLYRQGEHTTTDRLAILENHQREIQKQIKDLVATEEMLSDKITIYKRMLKASTTSNLLK